MGAVVSLAQYKENKVACMQQSLWERFIKIMGKQGGKGNEKVEH